MDATLIVHIVAGLFAISVGYVALGTAKGQRAHRISGRAFVYSMIAMALIGSWMAATRGKSPEANVPIGFLTAYLVVTGLTTMRPPQTGGRRFDAGLAVLAAIIGLALVAFGIESANSPTGKLHSIPTLPFFIFGTIALLASAGDFHLIRSGGVHLIRGAPRLTRHLWRMCFALLVAAFSFFPRVARVIPKGFPVLPIVLTPALIVLGAMIYWLWRVRTRRSLRGIRALRTPKPA